MNPEDHLAYLQDEARRARSLADIVDTDGAETLRTKLALFMRAANESVLADKADWDKVVAGRARYAMGKEFLMYLDPEIVRRTRDNRADELAEFEAHMETHDG